MKEVVLLIARNQAGEILLQHKDNSAPNWPNSWCLFGGQIEEAETPEATLERELVEELEWVITDYSSLFTEETDGVRRHVFSLLTSKTADELQQAQREGDGLGFFSPDKLQTIKICKPHLIIINQYLMI